MEDAQRYEPEKKGRKTRKRKREPDKSPRTRSPRGRGRTGKRRKRVGMSVLRKPDESFPAPPMPSSLGNAVNAGIITEFMMRHASVSSRDPRKS